MGVDQALSHRAYSWLGLGDRVAAARSLLVGAPAGALLGSAVAAAAAALSSGPGQWPAAGFAVAQALYLSAATVLLVLDRERALLCALLPMTAGALLALPYDLAEPLRTGLLLASLATAVCLAVGALVTGIPALWKRTAPVGTQPRTPLLSRVRAAFSCRPGRGCAPDLVASPTTLGRGPQPREGAGWGKSAAQRAICSRHAGRRGGASSDAASGTALGRGPSRPFGRIRAGAGAGAGAGARPGVRAGAGVRAGTGTGARAQVSGRDASARPGRTDRALGRRDRAERRPARPPGRDARAAPRIAASLPYGFFGLGTGALVLYTALGDVLAGGAGAVVSAPSAVALTLSMGPAEWLLHRFRGESLAGLRASTTSRAFWRGAAAVLAECLAGYLAVLFVLALAGTLLWPDAPALGGMRLATLLLIGAVLWTGLLLQSFGAVTGAAAVCCAAALAQTVALATGAGSAHLVGLCVAAVAAALLAGLVCVLLGRATAHRG